MGRTGLVDRPEEAWDLSCCACLEDRADLGKPSLDPEVCVGPTGPVDRSILPVDLTDGIASDSIPYRATSAARGHLVRPSSPDLNRLRVGGGSGGSGGYPQRAVEIARPHLNQVVPDRVAITDCRKTFMLSVQHLILKASHFGVSICQVRSQPPQLILDLDVFSKVVRVGLGQIL